MPPEFKKWVGDNLDKIERVRQAPYFVRDNNKFDPRLQKAYISRVRAMAPELDASVKAIS